MYKYIFLLGRPGSGKSALYHKLKKRVLKSSQAKTVERVDDFPKLWARFQRDDALEIEGKERIYTTRTADGNYLINNHKIMNDVLIEFNADLLRSDQPEHMVFLEFARSNYVEALRHFDERILANCLAIYMKVPFDICWARNVARHQAAIAAGTDVGGDDHLVPREVMENNYLFDDQDAFIQHMEKKNVPVSVVNNETNGDEHLREQVEGLFNNLF